MTILLWGFCVMGGSDAVRFASEGRVGMTLIYAGYAALCAYAASVKETSS